MRQTRSQPAINTTERNEPIRRRQLAVMTSQAPATAVPEPAVPAFGPRVALTSTAAAGSHRRRRTSSEAVQRQQLW